MESARGRQTECSSDNQNERRQRGGWLGTESGVRNRIKEHSCIKKAQVREERKRRSDKRKASTKEANKEHLEGGINHCPTYPSSRRFLSFTERFGPMFSHSIAFCPFSSPTTVPLPPPPSIHPSIHTSVHPSVLWKQHRPSHVCPLFFIQKNTFVYASICQRTDKSRLQNTGCNCPVCFDSISNIVCSRKNNERKTKKMMENYLKKKIKIKCRDTSECPPTPCRTCCVLSLRSAHKRIPL